MSIYLRTAAGERLLLDTAKAKLDFEGRVIDLSGVRLDLYEVGWMVGEGTLGDEQVPCKVLVFHDEFSGVRIEIPLPLDRVETFLASFEMNGKSGRWGRLLGR